MKFKLFNQLFEIKMFYGFSLYFYKSKTPEWKYSWSLQIGGLRLEKLRY